MKANTKFDYLKAVLATLLEHEENLQQEQFTEELSKIHDNFDDVITKEWSKLTGVDSEHIINFSHFIAYRRPPVVALMPNYDSYSEKQKKFIRELYTHCTIGSAFLDFDTFLASPLE